MTPLDVVDSAPWWVRVWAWVSDEPITFEANGFLITFHPINRR